MNYDLMGAQIRAARALLGWDLKTLAQASGVSQSTIQKFEAEGLTGQMTTVRAVLKALQSAGIEFPTNGRGVDLKSPTSESPGAAA